MVLEKLGDSLKNTLGKIAKAVFVDEKLINELVKDIQRALLQSDTNVQLVFDLSKKFNKNLGKKPCRNLVFISCIQYKILFKYKLRSLTLKYACV